VLTRLGRLWIEQIWVRCLIDRNFKCRRKLWNGNICLVFSNMAILKNFMTRQDHQENKHTEEYYADVKKKRKRLLARETEKDQLVKSVSKDGVLKFK
jgi:hypothetical protein